MKKRKEKQVIEYTNEFNDDYAETNINRKPLGDDFKYVNKNIFFRFTGWFVTFCLMIPILWIGGKIHLGFRIKNRKVLRKVKGTGYFLYSNHVAMLDPVMHCIVNWPRKSYIIAGQDAFSIKGIKTLVKMLGAVPLPDTPEQRASFYECIKYRVVDQKAAMIVYPEAHIWKYFNGIRTLRPATFRFPCRLNTPIVIATTTWRKRHWPWKRPRMIINLHDPIYPDPSLDERDNAAMVTAKAQEIMESYASSPDNYEYIRYQKKSVE